MVIQFKQTTKLSTFRIKMIINHPKNKHSLTVLIGIFVFLITAVYCQSQAQSQNINGVIILNQQSLEQALKTFPNLVVYFSSSSCSFCGQMDLTYAIIQEKFRKSYYTKQISKTVSFGKVLYQQQPQIFKRYGVLAAPAIKIFTNGVLKNIEYDCLDYNQEAIIYSLEWIKRAITPVTEITVVPTGIEKTTVVYSCNIGSESQINKLRIRDINTDYFCTKNSSVLSSASNIKIYSLIVPNGQEHPLSTTQIQRNIQKLIFRHKGLLPWDNYAIRNIFNYKHNAFILLTNQDDYSQEMKMLVEKIRIQQNITEMFVVGNLSQNLQEIIKIKEYIGVPLKALYPYPLLVYLSHQNDRIAKYSYNNRIDDFVEESSQEKSIKQLNSQIRFDIQDISAWIAKAIKGEAKQHFRTMTKIQFKIPKSPTYSITRLAYPDLAQLFDKKNQLQFFIYITWRNDYLCNAIEGKIVDHWEEEKASSYSNMFTLGYNNNDILPQFQNLIKRLPAILYVDSQKQTNYTDKIGTYEDAIKFVNDNYKKVQLKTVESQKSQVKITEEQMKMSQKKASHVESNIDHLNVMKVKKHSKQQKNQVQQQQPQKPIQQQPKKDQVPLGQPIIPVEQPIQFVNPQNNNDENKVSANQKEQIVQPVNKPEQAVQPKQANVPQVNQKVKTGKKTSEKKKTVNNQAKENNNAQLQNKNENIQRAQIAAQ